MMRLRWWIRRVDRDGSRGQYPRIGWIEFQLHLLNDGVVHSVCMCESIMVHDDGARDKGGRHIFVRRRADEGNNAAQT